MGRTPKPQLMGGGWGKDGTAGHGVVTWSQGLQTEGPDRWLTLLSLPLA